MGTRKHPLRTPRRLLASLKDGQIGCLRGGTYGSSTSYHRLSASGATNARRTLTAYPGERAVVAGYVEVLGSFVTLRRLVFDGSNPYLVDAGKCGTQALGILLHGSDIVFERNEVYQSGLKGSAILQDGDRNVIRYNKLHDFGSCYHYDHGIYVGDGDAVQIYENWIWNNQHGWGIQVYPGPTNARIHDNVIDANGGGFVISDNGSATSTGNQVYHNIVVNSVGLTTQAGGYVEPAGLSGPGTVPGSNNSFTSNAVFNTAVGGAPNVTVTDNQTVDPRFVDAAGHNYALSPLSPLSSWKLWNGR